MALNQFAVISPQTAAKVSPIQDALDCDSIIVSADNLAGAEVVTLQVMAGSTAKQISDIYGVAVNLTVTCPAVALEGGAQYQFSKGITAGLCGVYVSVKNG